MANKTIEQFVVESGADKPVYTPHEIKEVYEIVSEFYEGDDIEEFIYSDDIDAKEEFIEENEIVNLRVCDTCGKFIKEGYLYQDYDMFCSKECFIDAYGKAIFDNADDDELYWANLED